MSTSRRSCLDIAALRDEYFDIARRLVQLTEIIVGQSRRQGPDAPLVQEAELEGDRLFSRQAIIAEMICDGPVDCTEAIRLRAEILEELCEEDESDLVSALTRRLVRDVLALTRCRKGPAGHCGR